MPGLLNRSSNKQFDRAKDSYLITLISGKSDPLEASKTQNYMKIADSV
jgi:hypothetical protein